MKHLFLCLMLLTSTIQAEMVGCNDVYRHIQASKHNIDMLWQDISLQRLDIQSFNADQHKSLEFAQKMDRYTRSVENYNAIVAGHDQLINQYQEMCE